MRSGEWYWIEIPRGLPELDALCALVGEARAGKSNLLDVIAFLGDATRDDLAPALDERGGFDRVIFRGAPEKRPTVSIEVEAAVTKNSSHRATDTYVLSFSLGPLGGRSKSYFLRRSETFAFKRTAGPGRRITVKGGKITFHRPEGGERTASLREGMRVEVAERVSPPAGVAP